MVNKNLVGRCGLYCGACGIYRAYKDNGEFLTRIANSLKCSVEKVRCEGCMALTPECWGNGCKIVQCLNSKGFQFCYECSEWEKKTCGKYEKLAKNYLEDGEDIRTSLMRIKRGETEEWLSESEQNYRCPECEKPLPVYGAKGKCYHCGANLRKRNR
ncbi:MAG: DUF3795 domain-containing protein [Candidatus Brockarchaeota archaeon]|nr:DUF3795 domain-containing protein [Candidatus Brockarchaeota archaeon]